MRVKISNPSKDVLHLLNALTDSYALSERVEWEEGREGDDMEGPFIVIHIDHKFPGKAVAAFAKWVKSNPSVEIIEV